MTRSFWLLVATIVSGVLWNAIVIATIAPVGH
jgi:hypothetical protein